MPNFGEATTPFTAVGRNWKSMRWVALAGGASLIAFVWYTTTSRGAVDKKDELTSSSSTTTEKMVIPDFETGYARKAIVAPAAASVPAGPAVVAPPVPIVAPPPQARATVTQPPKPMLSMFVGATDPEGAEYWKKQESVQAGSGGGGLQQQGEYRPGMSDGVDKLEADQRQGLSAQKNAWLASAGTGGDDVVRAPYLPPASRYIIQAGTIIQATALTAGTSDLPGDIVAQINRDVPDTITGRCTLIPAGAKLYGRINSQISFGQERLQPAWTRLMMPNGYSMNLGSMAATDASGMAGVEGDVDHHALGMAGAIALSAGLSIVGQAGQLFADNGGGNSQVNYAQIGAQGAGNATSSIGGQMVQKQLALPNTITLHQGDRISLLLSKDAPLPPYQGKCT